MRQSEDANDSVAQPRFRKRAQAGPATLAVVGDVVDNAAMPTSSPHRFATC